MNKKVLNSTATTIQNSTEQTRLEIKVLIINLGTATQLTLGGGGNQNEGNLRQIYIKDC